MRFVPFEALRGVPNVVCGGVSAGDTLLTLSHWPGSGTPDAFVAGTSTESALRYLSAPELAPEARAAEACSSSLFDVDACLGLFALLTPESAWAHAERLVAAARAANFGVVEDEPALMVAATVAALGRGREEPFAFALPLVRRVLDEPERFAAHWGAAVDAHRRGVEAFASGAARIDEDAALDLAVVRSDRPLADSAVNSSTTRLRVASAAGRVMQLTFRAETWGADAHRAPAPRLDVAPLAERLNELEPARGRWVFDGVGDVIASLYLEGPDGDPAPSALSFDAFLAQVRAELESAALDPARRWSPPSASEGRA